MLQQWRLEACRFIEGNRKWDIWLHDWELEPVRHNVQAWFQRASFHVCAVPRKVLSHPAEGWFKVCVLLLWRRVPRWELLPWLGGAVEALLWLMKPCVKQPQSPHLEVLCYSCGSTQNIRILFEVVEFSPKEYWAGGGNRKMILILHYTESLALLTVAYCFLPQSSAQSLSGRGYSVSHFTANSFTSVDVDCRGLHYLLHSHWHGRNAEQKQGESTGLLCTWQGTALTCESALRAWRLLNLILYL